MGGACTKAEVQQTAITSQQARQNSEKDSWYTIIPNQYTGEGIKRVPAYESKMTRDKIMLKRQEFWSSRSEGKREVWMCIKRAIEESDVATALLLLQSYDILPHNNSILQCHDSNGKLYEVPVWVISDPQIHFNQVVEQEVSNFQNETIKIRNNNYKDTDLTIDTLQTVAQLKDKYLSIQPSISKDLMRLFYGGKELKDSDTLALHKLKNEVVVQCFVRSN